jgi:hypothetical protein
VRCYISKYSCCSATIIEPQESQSQSQSRLQPEPTQSSDLISAQDPVNISLPGTAWLDANCIRPLSSCTEYATKTKRRRCCVCSQHCSHYCTICSRPSQNHFVVIHSPIAYGTNEPKTCWFKHFQSHNANS